MPGVFLSYPLTLWLAIKACMHAVLGPKWATCRDNVGHAILLQSCAKVLHYSPLKKLALLLMSPQESEATVREVDSSWLDVSTTVWSLIQHTRVINAVNRWILNNTAVQAHPQPLMLLYSSLVPSPYCYYIVASPPALYPLSALHWDVSLMPCNVPRVLCSREL